MEIIERFSSVLSSMEFQLARSLPIFDDGKEIFFFYVIEEVNINEYKIPEVRYVVYRDIRSGHIDVINAKDVIPQELIDSLIGSINKHNLSVEEELKAEKEFFELYEKMIQEYGVTSYDTKKLKRISQLFNKLIDGTRLLPIYKYLGKEFCDLISSNN